MEDAALNSQLVETKELQTRWRQFSDFVEMAYSGKPCKPEAEMKFMELKSRIAMLHDGFMESLEHDQSTGQNMVELLNNCVTLARLTDASEADRKKFKFDWNECYLLVTEQISHLNAEVERLDGINERAYRASQRRDAIKAKIVGFFTGPGFKGICWVASIVVVLYVIPTFVWSYRNFGHMSWSKGIYKTVVNTGYRPFLSKDYEYNELGEVEHPDAYNQDQWRVEKGPTQKDLENTLNGFFGAAGPGLVNHLKKNLKSSGDFSTNRVTGKRANESGNGSFYYMVFKTSQAAKDFIEMGQNAVKAMPTEQQRSIDNNIWAKRRANFVAIGVTNHQLRMGFLTEKWGFKQDQPSDFNSY